MRKFRSASRKREKVEGGSSWRFASWRHPPREAFRRGRFAFNRDPRPTYTAACVPSRYEFIVYTERPPVHIRKLIVQAVNYSACTPATAAAVPPHVCCVQALFHAYTCISRCSLYWYRGKIGKIREKEERFFDKEWNAKTRMKDYNFSAIHCSRIFVIIVKDEDKSHLLISKI